MSETIKAAHVVGQHGSQDSRPCVRCGLPLAIKGGRKTRLCLSCWHVLVLTPEELEVWL